MTSLCLIVESGTDVRLVEGLAEKFDLSILARRIEGGVEVNHPPARVVPTLTGPSSRLGFARLVWRHLRKNRRAIDGVMVQGYGLAALAANLAGRLNRVPTAMLVCSPVEAYYRCRKISADSGKPFRRRELLMLKTLARVNALIGQRYVVLSQHLAEVVRSHGARVPVEVIPVYGVDTELFAPPREAKASIRRRLNLPETGKLVFFSSRIAPEKDSETLLKATRRLLDAGHDLWLLHRSGGHQAFAREAAKFGLAERVLAADALHPQKELPAAYQASDLCVQASREEGLGFSPLEALACGVPVVAASIGGLKETIIDGETGWTYPVGDVVALAGCMADALTNTSEAARRTRAGRALVCAGYDSRLVFERLDKMAFFADEQSAVSLSARA